MLTGLQGRLSLLYIAFVMLVLISVGATIWGLEMQRQDALVINLAGRQRMLAQQMARLAFEAGAGQEFTNHSLQEVEQTFDQTLHALLDGGTAPYLSDTPVTLETTRAAEIRSALQQLGRSWSEQQIQLDTLQRTSRDDPSFARYLQAVEQKSSMLAAQSDEVVRLYEAQSLAKVRRLRTMQIGFLAGALILLGVGAVVTRRSVLKPLKELSRAVVRLGENDLDRAVQVEGPAEMQALGEAFESMRVSLSASRAELVNLADSLEKHVAQRTAELDALNEVSREISSRLDVQQVLDSVTDKALALLGADVASLCLLDEGGRFLNMQAISGPNAAVLSQQVASDSPLTARVLNSTGAILCDAGNCIGVCQMLAEPFRASHIVSSLRSGDKVIGALCVGGLRPRQFGREASDLLGKLANSAAIALENARLYRQAERLATLEERRRIAAEMHDGLAQTLSYLGLVHDQVVEFLKGGEENAALQKLEQARVAIRNATHDVRRAIDNLMDEVPVRQGLAEHIQALVLDFARKHEMSIEWENLADQNLPYSREQLEQILHIAREALTNAHRHARASRVAVRFGQKDGQYELSVEDDGAGFDPQKVKNDGPDHFGLQIMQARGTHIGGRVEVLSRPGEGTRLELHWPVEEAG